MDLMVEASPRRIFANAHTYHINSISVNSDHETYLSADDLRINLWHLEITDRSFNIVDIKPVNMEELTEVITAAEFHPHQCNVFVYSSSKGTIRLCDMRSSALCDRHSKFFEEPEDPSSRSFFSEIISSISDVRFSHSGRYMMTRDYLSVKVWDLNMESRPVETHQVHEYLRSKLCSLYENDCIFDKFECCWGGSDRSLALVMGQHDKCHVSTCCPEELSGPTSPNQRPIPRASLVSVLAAHGPCKLAAGDRWPPCGPWSQVAGSGVCALPLGPPCTPAGLVTAGEHSTQGTFTPERGLDLGAVALREGTPRQENVRRGHLGPGLVGVVGTSSDSASLYLGCARSTVPGTRACQPPGCQHWARTAAVDLDPRAVEDIVSNKPGTTHNQSV
ncbi:serine/threonine-protein phosphatase 2A 55 kDa regulatory subunit B delta isoform isoform X1 [Felis catus]|uniref:serine/threonine-protein phosphatase 2A 55 kDa regulatory subunit B delta isoform isoform X1 n=1 Tax=Felis catus TaxID=9685 RepID=UPI001D198C27|nr:serine/threonine-protein phosphatase 2A 55 kDa regulatory subunit B delta isoform isoform X1 [Felis catus]